MYKKDAKEICTACEDFVNNAWKVHQFSIPAELGSLNYVAELGVVLQEGDLVNETGFWDANGGLALRSLTLVDTGITYQFRDELARPLWAGPKGNGH